MTHIEIYELEQHPDYSYIQKFFYDGILIWEQEAVRRDDGGFNVTHLRRMPGLTFAKEHYDLSGYEFIHSIIVPHYALSLKTVIQKTKEVGSLTNLNRGQIRAMLRSIKVSIYFMKAD